MALHYKGGEINAHSHITLKAKKGTNSKRQKSALDKVNDYFKRFVIH